MNHLWGTGLDSFTRKYLMVLGTFAAAAVIAWAVSWDGRVNDINKHLAADGIVAAYPYEFRVISIENAAARVSSPRSAQMSAIQGLRVLFPELKQEGATSNAMEAAQRRMATTQSRARSLILEHPEVKRVVWVLDEVWLNSHGVFVQ